MNSPKARFLETEHAKKWLDLSVNPAFEAAVDAAMLQFAADLGGTLAGPHSPDQPIANAWQLEGARKFAFLLANLSEPPQKPPRQLPKVNYGAFEK